MNYKGMMEMIAYDLSNKQCMLHALTVQGKNLIFVVKTVTKLY